MGQLVAAMAVKAVHALHHIIRLTRALLVALARDNAGTIAPGGHGPELSLLGGMEGFGLAERGKAGAVMGLSCCDHWEKYLFLVVE